MIGAQKPLREGAAQYTAGKVVYDRIETATSIDECVSVIEAYWIEMHTARLSDVDCIKSNERRK